VSMVSRLSERVEKLEPREPSKPALALAQQRAQPQVETGESAQALRQQVSDLMGNVSWLSNNIAAGGLGRSSLGAAGTNASPVDKLVGSSSRTPVGSSSRAPSPRKWLSEPLSVSVARSDLPSFTASPVGTSVGGLGSTLAAEQQRYLRPATAKAHGRDF